MIGKANLLTLLLITLAAPLLSSAQEQQSSTALVEANTRFAFKFFHQAVAKTPDANVLTSPTALSLDFALLQNGADADAREEILNAFELRELSAEQINQQSLALRKALSYAPTKPPSRRDPQGMPPPPPICCALLPEHLTLAGSLWTQPGVEFRRGFLEANRRFYSFQTASVPDKGQNAVNAVNAWVLKQTGGKLTKALDSWQRDGFLLVDTTWFKGTWMQPFAETATRPGDFTVLSGQKEQVPMMAKGGHFLYYLRGPKFQAVGLNYQRAMMYVFLPDEDSSLKEFEQTLDADNWAKWVSEFRSHEGYLELPRFKSEYREDVTATLTALGMKRAFTAFSSFAPLVVNPEGAKLTHILQMISLKVDEKGTEVVSGGVVGGVPGGISAGPAPEPFRMIVNRPFFFVICDYQTHAILYMGAIIDPLASGALEQ